MVDNRKNDYLDYMIKLTDPAYQLPNIMALAAFDTFDSGTTEPMGINGVDMQSAERGQFVVKFKNAKRMSVKSSCRELLGAWMALEMDIHCVEPALINITDDFVKTLSGRQGYKAAFQSVGYNFGSVYKPGYQIMPANAFHLNEDIKQQARRIFMFDMLVGNADRGAGKPNVLSNGEKLLVFDHELAFSFADLLSFARNPTPWIFGPFETEMYRQHYFYNVLRGELHDFADTIPILDSFNDEFWKRARNWIPEEWKTEELNLIRQHVNEIAIHKTEFAKQLTIILAA